MKLPGAVKRYRRRLSKRFTKEIHRKQFNFYCDRDLIAIVRYMADKLEIPVYPLMEHIVQLGVHEIIVLEGDEASRDQLCRHLVRDHLLTPVTKPMSEPISRRLLQLRNAMDFLRLLESRNGPEEQKEIIRELVKKVRD